MPVLMHLLVIYVSVLILVVATDWAFEPFDEPTQLDDKCDFTTVNTSAWLPRQWKDFQSDLRKYLFEYDRISHMRLQFSTALQTAILIGGAVALEKAENQALPVTLGISVFGLILLLISWTAVSNLDNRIWLVHAILLGKIKGLENAMCHVHTVYLTGGPGGRTGKGNARRALVRWLPALFAYAYVALAWCTLHMKARLSDCPLFFW